MPFELLSLPELVEQGISSTSRIGRCLESLKQADSRTPLKEPLRAAQGAFAMLRHAISSRAREDAKKRDYCRMFCEILATEISVRAGLEQRSGDDIAEEIASIADAENPCVIEDLDTIRKTVDAVRKDAVLKAGKNGAAFLRMCNVASERSESHDYKWKDIARKTNEYLPVGLQITDSEAQANACKTVQCMQILFSGCLRGQGRKKENKVLRAQKPGRGRQTWKRPAAFEESDASKRTAESTRR